MSSSDESVDYSTTIFLAELSRGSIFSLKKKIIINKESLLPGLAISVVVSL